MDSVQTQCLSLSLSLYSIPLRTTGRVQQLRLVYFFFFLIIVFNNAIHNVVLFLENYSSRSSIPPKKMICPKKVKHSLEFIFFLYFCSSHPLKYFFFF